MHPANGIAHQFSTKFIARHVNVRLRSPYLAPHALYQAAQECSAPGNHQQPEQVPKNVCEKCHLSLCNWSLRPTRPSNPLGSVEVSLCRALRRVKQKAVNSRACAPQTSSLGPPI